jgi:hypothetical protein
MTGSNREKMMTHFERLEVSHSPLSQQGDP